MPQDHLAADDASVEALVVRARDGDRAAFAELYDIYYAYVRSITRRIVSDDGLAEDLLQDAFITAWTNLPELRKLERFRPWLGRIAVHLAIRKLRQERRSRTWSPGGDDEVDPVLTLPDPGVDIERDVIVSESREAVRQAFLRLDEDKQEILALAYTLNLPSREIAAQLGCSDAAARKRLSRAYEALRAIMIEIDPTIAPEQREQRDKEPAR
jgi:RNA polymerase sigma-70 factor (ECF subfamily)